MSISPQIKRFKITRDKGVDLKRLKKLEQKGLIEIFDVKIENETKKVSKKILSVGVWDHSKWNEFVWGSGNCSYNDIRQTIGEDNIKDAMHLEAHIRNGFDYFVTNNPRDFIRNGKKESLEEQFPGLKIVTIDELEELC